MSVLACCRRYCENIMCDRYSYEYGYICDECYNELEHVLLQDPDHNITKFMDTRPSKYYEQKNAEEIFPRRQGL